MTHFRFSVFLAYCLVLSVNLTAQSLKPVTLDDIWGRTAGVFSQRTVQGVNWMKSGGQYTTQTDGRIVQYSITTGQPTDTLFDQRTATVTGSGQTIALGGYTLSADERKLLITTDEEPIYRRSSRAAFYVYNPANGQLKPLSNKGKQQYATFSPDGKRVAFVRDNNLFVSDLASTKETQLTTDGKRNAIINGAADWVYEEEFSMARAFEWSPDSRRVAWIRFDESRVPEYNMQTWGKLYPTDYRYKYPKAGETNSTVSVWIADLQSGKKVMAQTGTDTDIYLPRIGWTANPNLLSIRKLNRLQNRMDLIHVVGATGQAITVLTETSPTYVDLDFTDDLTYLTDGKGFIWTSERDRFKHVYLYDMAGKLIRQITRGTFEVSNLLGVDEKTQTAYYLSTEDSPLERQLYSVNLNGSGKRKLTDKPGTYTVNFSPDFQYFLTYHSAATQPQTIALRQSSDNRELRVLETNDALKKQLAGYAIAPKQFVTVPIPTGEKLNGWLIKPLDFDSTKRYPVLMFVYGGPGSQQVLNSWDSRDFFWYQTLVQKGYIIACVDNRGTGARGNAFRTSTYAQLGKLETQDQIEAGKYLKTLPWVDPTRVGIWGWSYGGYMSALCMTLGADVFKAGISVAPVTNWRYYDSIYTERYLKRPQDNAGGYDDNSPVTHANKLKGNYLLIHGTGDDNVHFQNSVEFEDALIKAGKQFRSFYYPNRNHGIYGGNTRLHLYRMMTDFVVETL